MTPKNILEVVGTILLGMLSLTVVLTLVGVFIWLGWMLKEAAF